MRVSLMAGDIVQRQDDAVVTSATPSIWEGGRDCYVVAPQSRMKTDPVNNN